MISIIGKPKETGARIRFAPRPEFASVSPAIERELVYGHWCPTCQNVVQACFKTDAPVNLWPYEETAVISIAQDEGKFGTVLKIVPNQGSGHGYSCYRSTEFRSSRAQHLVLKNHILNFEVISRGASKEDQWFEAGERTCEYTGYFALREDLLVRDICLFNKISWDYLKAVRIPPLDFLLKQTGLFHTLPSYGNAPPVVLARRKEVSSGYLAPVREALESYAQTAEIKDVMQEAQA